MNKMAHSQSTVVTLGTELNVSDKMADQTKHLKWHISGKETSTVGVHTGPATVVGRHVTYYDRITHAVRRSKWKTVAFPYANYSYLALLKSPSSNTLLSETTVR